MRDLPKPHADSTSNSFILLDPAPQLLTPPGSVSVINPASSYPGLISYYLGIRGNRCPCSWLVSGREPGDTLQCRRGHVPSCRYSVCTRPGSRSPPPHRIPPLGLCTPPCPSPLADRCLTHLREGQVGRKETVMFVLCHLIHILVCAQE